MRIGLCGSFNGLGDVYSSSESLHMYRHLPVASYVWWPVCYVATMICTVALARFSSYWLYSICPSCTTLFWHQLRFWHLGLSRLTSISKPLACVDACSYVTSVFDRQSLSSSIFILDPFRRRVFISSASQEIESGSLFVGGCISLRITFTCLLFFDTR